MLKRDWALKPDLLECMLEKRIVPAPLNNLGLIVLTSNGFSLVTPFPGASNSASGSLGAGGPSGGTAASVSGTAVPTSFYITGNRGISTFLPGNFTGNPAVGVAGTGGGSGGVGMTVQVGSGSDDASASGSSSTAASSRSNPGYNGQTAPIMAYIGSTSTGGDTPVLGAGQNAASGTVQVKAPVPALPPLGQVIPGSPMGTSTAGMIPSNPLNPQAGAPTFRPGISSLVRPLPGSLQIQGGLLGPSAGPSN
jgi:hypothetical protein